MTDAWTRRGFLYDLGLGTAALSLAGDGVPGQLPGQPSRGVAQAESTRPSTVMAIAAHPGDAFFAMGACIALATHSGGRGVFLSLSLGERGSASIPPDQYATLQRQAAERAATFLRAQAAFLGYPDGQIPVSDQAKLAVCDVIREHKPDVIVTHWQGSWHKDHRACHQVANDAAFYAALPTLTRNRPAHAVRKTFFADNWEDAEGFVPDTFLDITPVIDRWLEACALFPMWRGETGFRYRDYYQSLAVCRGCVAGFKSAVALMSPPGQLIRRASVW